MFPPPASTGRKLVVAFVAFMAAAGAISILTLDQMLKEAASEQRQTLGKTLTEQLAETARQPLVNGDMISLQVILDNLVSRSDQVIAAHAYDPSGEPLASSGPRLARPAGSGRFSQTVAFENSPAGEVAVVLAKGTPEGLRQPVWILALAWASVTVGFAFWLGRCLGRDHRRLTDLIHRLPGDVEPGGDALSTLEKRLAPLLAEPESDHTGSQAGALLAVRFLSLPRLRAQLSVAHFEGLLADLGTILEQVAQLWGGQILEFRAPCTFLYFADDGKQVPAVRALAAGRLLADAGRRWCDEQGTPLELGFAVAPCHIPGADHLAAQVALDERASQAARLCAAASPWQVLTDDTLIEDSAVADACDLAEMPANSDLYELQAVRNDSLQRQLQEQIAFIAERTGLFSARINSPEFYSDEQSTTPTFSS